MFKHGLVYAAVAVAVLTTSAAKANFIFSGAGTSGTLASATETWQVSSLAPAGDFGWGSPGVSAGSTTYGEATPATNFEITFARDLLDTSQIAVGNTQGCAGTETGGTTFCGDGSHWTASLTGQSSIAFFAPSGESLAAGELYFVNIFLVGSENPVSFSGFWSTAAVPEPGTLAILGLGLAGLGWIRRKRAT